MKGIHMKKTSTILFCLLLCAPTFAKNTYIGEQYLGAKYATNPLGEEKAPDTDPLIRTDAFDCTTFVETSLADGDVDKLTKIRYKDGKIDFKNRNHFIETDWIKNNANIVENISDTYGKTSTKTVTIDKKSWFKKIYKTDTDFKKQTAKIQYLPISEVSKIKTDKPLIVLFLAENSQFRNRFGSDFTVTHMGFLLPNGMLRHASRKQGKVVDTDFDKYIKHRKENKNNIGIALLKIK